MSNLEEARAALHAELDQAKQQLHYYQSVVANLEEITATLASLVIPVTATGQGKRVNNKPPAAPSTKVKRGRGRPPMAAKEIAADKPKPTNKKQATELPKTGNGFILGLLTHEPMTYPELVQVAAAAIGGNLSDEQMRKLKGRLTTNVNALVKSKAIKDSGSGRDRQFTLA